MRGLRGRRGRAVALAAVLGLVVLGASTVLAVVLIEHRPPPAVTVGTHPPSAPGTAVVPAGEASVPATVRVDQSTEAISVPVGTLIDVELGGDPTYRWGEPWTTTPQLLDRLSASTGGDGNASGSFRAVSTGDAVIMAERSSACSSGPTGGVCAVDERRIRVTVTG